MQNQVVHMIIPDESSGIKIIELSGWTGKVLIIPRTSLRSLKERKESLLSGIYFLFGDSEDSTYQKLYIGESEVIINRLNDHDAKKDFWSNAIVFVGGLDKAKVRYLEWIATQEAKEVGRYEIMNSVGRKENSLTEYDEISTRDFFQKMKYVLSILDYPIFENIKESISDSKIYYLKTKEGVDAKAQLLSDGSLNVLKGSLARMRETEAFWGWSKAARKKFLDDGTLVENGDSVSYRYTRDTLFNSPSAASATTLGSPSNGWTAWKDEQGNTLDDNLRK
jgi:hypothetical protein